MIDCWGEKKCHSLCNVKWDINILGEIHRSQKGTFGTLYDIFTSEQWEYGRNPFQSTLRIILCTICVPLSLMSSVLFTDTSVLAEQVSTDWQTLLWVEELRYSHADPRRPGECDCQAVTSKAADNKLLLTKQSGMTNHEFSVLELLIACGLYLMSSSNEIHININSEQLGWPQAGHPSRRPGSAQWISFFWNLFTTIY